MHCFDLQFKTWRHCSWGASMSGATRRLQRPLCSCALVGRFMRHANCVKIACLVKSDLRSFSTAGQQLQDMAPNAILMLGKLKLMPSSTDGGQLAAALSKEASAWWPATPVAAFVLSGNRLKFAWANEPKQRDMPSMHGDDIIPGKTL